MDDYIKVYLYDIKRANIDTRNRIIHGYDSVKPEFLWSLVLRHIPALKINIDKIIAEYDVSPTPGE